ncbi:unnamed protein product [Rhizophagus irregularis]|uniref:Uncharacterized protein n=1 Tax=Rhizophagus irregularis TaxID=588596 RepID=A0A2N1MEG8_9GLOM|nr:hypothetical protein RhiirC2_793945 [Rhizophagus irregularis]CAB5296201.1 unnamed protein product [Rhizophagus irregularis]
MLLKDVHHALQMRGKSRWKKPFVKGPKTGIAMSKCVTRKSNVYQFYQKTLRGTFSPITSTHIISISLLIKRIRPRIPPIVEDKVIETNNYNQATFFSDKLIMDFHRAHFARNPPVQHQRPSTPEPDHIQSIKDGDERPIAKPRKRKIKFLPTPGHDY